MMEIDVIFRCDSSIQIGSGHLIRCRTLARELSKAGLRVGFICRRLDGSLLSILSSEFWVGVLEDSSYSSELSCKVRSTYPNRSSEYLTQLDDACQTINLIQNTCISNPSLIVVDHYLLGAPWEEAIISSQFLRNSLVMVIDDLANREHVCHIFLDQNWDAETNAVRYKGLLANTTTRLMGPDYCMLDPGYANAKQFQQPRQRIDNVFIYFGAYDLHGLTIQSLQALKELDYASFTIDIILSADDLLQREQALSINSFGDRLRIHEPRPNLIPFLLTADFALGAGGTTTWERACLGVPTLTTTVAENQKDHAIYFNKKMPTNLLNLDPSRLSYRIRQTFPKFLKSSDLLTDCSRLVFDLVDGYGTTRVTRAILDQLK